MNQPPLRRLAYAMMGSSWWLATAMMSHAAPAAAPQTPPAATPAAGKAGANTAGKADAGKPEAGKTEPAKAGEKTAPGTPESGAAAPADAAPPAPIRNPPLRLEIRRNQPLAKQIQQLEGAEGNVIWLGDAKEPFLGLYIENYAKQSLGAVLLLHDNEQHPDWPGMLHELRSSFPQHGWSTLSIALPDLRPIPPILPPLPKPVEAAPATPATPEGAGEKAAEGKPADGKATEKKDAAATDKNKDGDKNKDTAKDKNSAKDTGKDKAATGKNDGKTDSKDPKTAGIPENKPAEATPPAAPPPPEFLQRDSEVAPEKFPAEVERRIREATHYLINEGVQHVVIVAFGNTAGLAAHISRNMLINELDGLVMMDAKPYADARYDLPTDTADLRIPVLDVVPELDPGSNPLLRKQTTTRAHTPQYEMRSVAGASSNFFGFEPYVFKAVKGWADTQFRNAPERKDRTQQANRKRAEKAAQPAPTAPATTTPASAPPATPATAPGQAPAAPPPPKNGSPAPNLKDPIPPPVP